MNNSYINDSRKFNFLYIKKTLSTKRFHLSKTEKAKIIFPPEFLEMIWGLLLGDGSLIKVGNDVRLGIDQKDKELTYDIWYKCQAIGIVGAEPRKSIRIRQEGTYTSYQFFTVTLPYFTDLHKSWYKKDENRNIKILPYNIKELLTPIALAYWISGDGTYKKDRGQIIICTDNFTKKEVELLISILNEKFGIDSKISNKKNQNKVYYRIAILPKDSLNVQKLGKGSYT